MSNVSMSNVYTTYKCVDCNNQFIRWIDMTDIDVDETLDKDIEEFIIYKQSIYHKCSSCVVNEYINNNYGCEHRSDSTVCMMCKLWEHGEGELCN